MKRLAGLLGAALALWVVYGLVAPGPIDPVAWVPPPVRAPSPATAPNRRLEAVEWWARQLQGPEAITLDSEGRVVTGLRDGRIVRLKAGSDEVEQLGHTGGRPLAVRFHPSGRLIICDARRGLLSLDLATQAIEVLATEEGGVPFAFVDDLDITATGVIYFSDASSRNSIERFTLDLLEHRTTGRILRYDPNTRQLTKLADGIAFANGVALGPNDAYLVFSETGTYQLWRVWLEGPKAGKRELFVDSLPGFPDNLRYSKDRHVFWVAIASPRKPDLDALASFPRVRKLISRLPEALQPAPARHAWIQAVDENGQLGESLQFEDPNSYSPIACATEFDGYLYLGSFAREGLARVRLP